MPGNQYSSWMLERIAIGDTVRLRLGTSTIGRHSSSSIRVLQAGYVSRHHAIFEVSDNDENVTIKDVSSNGVFINERRYDKAVVQLKNDDHIGFGVSPINIAEGVDITTLPIYKIKYSPLSTIKYPSKTTISSSGPKESLNNVHRDEEKPCVSTAVKKERFNADEIFEISDDDESDDAENKPALKPNENHKDLITTLNHHIEVAIKSEPSDDSVKINPSQKSQEKRIEDDNSKDNNKMDVVEKGPEKKEGILMPATNCNTKEDTKEIAKPMLHIPIISDIKREHLRSVSIDIENIFGDIQDDIDMQKAIKQINPLVYSQISVSKNILANDDEEKVLTNGAVINLTDDEDLEEAEVEELGTIIPNITQTKENLNTILKECKQEIESNNLSTEELAPQPKSPNIFDSSLDNSKEEIKAVVDTVNNRKIPLTDIADNIDLDEYTKYVPHSDDEDVEDLMFSQVLINDMKAELQDDLNSEDPFPVTDLNENNEIPAPAATADTTVKIKQEPGLELFAQIPKELENSCWIISDDDEYDEELETKVNDWSNKIFSQNPNLMSQNLSQVYEMQESDKNRQDEEDDDFWEDDHLSLLEDDLDGIAEIYNSFGDTTEPPTDAISKTNEITNDDATQAGIEESVEVKEQQQSAEIDIKDDKVIKVEKSNDIAEKSPIKETMDSESETVSPLVRSRRTKKSHPLQETSSTSSEEEPETKAIKLPAIIIPDKPIPKALPPVIAPPALPRHKGKLRGVSADMPKATLLNSKSVAVNKTLYTIKEKILHERISNDLKRKWLEKPSITKKRDKERRNLIKECRKDKLKELAERKKTPANDKDSVKRKPSTDGNEPKAKVAKVKVTTHNRGAFLANKEETPAPAAAAAQHHKPEQKTQFKIPKMNKKVDEPIKPAVAKEPPTRSFSMDGFETFSQQLAKPDELLLRQQNNEAKKSDKSELNHHEVGTTVPLRRHSVADSNFKPALERKETPPPLAASASNAVCKESIAKRAIRTTNKITFASMEKNIVESEENKRKLSALSAQTSDALKSINKNTTATKTAGKKKTVRFNDTPVIHYIERISGACRKVTDKDIRTCRTTFMNRRYSTRAKFSIVDRTNEIISNILCWSNEWLKKRNAQADAAADIVFPMPTQFTSFEHYKSIVFPLMKLEFVSTLEREYNATRDMKMFKVSHEYATMNDDRVMLVTRFPSNHTKAVLDSSLFDLVILEPDMRGLQIFAFVVANRKGAGTFSTIVYEVIAKNFTIEFFKHIKEFCVRPVMDRVRVHFGAFNSVYQLQATPLFQKIINPLELLNNKPPPKRIVIYKAPDKLNEKQKEVLLNTYMRIIDEATPNITLIQGPPGTGKSLVITNLVLQCLYGEDVRFLDKKILICAQSNAAVDVLTLKLLTISKRMRDEKRFRLIRYGILNKMHSSVLPVALQKVVERDQLKKLQARNKNVHLENKENLKSQILQFEAQVAEMSARNVKGTVEEDVLIEKKRQIQLMRNILNENMRPEDERSLFSWYLTNANIICATLSSCVNLSQYVDYFDICVIDEATQCTEPWTLLPLKFGINSLVLVGDTQQLPATVLSKKANELGLGTSMFTRIQRCLDNIPSTSARGATTPNHIIYSLQTQYRMHPEICRWPNHYFYRNELENAKQTIDCTKTPLVPFCILNLNYTQNNGGVNGKITNNMEAEFVAKLLKALDGFIPNKYNTYGVITPYAHHRATLESAIRALGLTNIMVNTIDSYQGLEKDVIVISNARTSGIGFLSNPQRLNVALTRAKKCLILCGNFRNLESVPAWRCLLENARERHLYYEISENSIEDIYSNVINKIKLTNHNR